jgi:regulatory protein YycH of two-component signal transduction system YycFG
MAAVTYTDGTEYIQYAGETKVVTWKSPATMDSNDTVVIPKTFV